MISRKVQLSPMHRHIVKVEDIINRGGARLALQLHNSNSNRELDENSEVTLYAMVLPASEMMGIFCNFFLVKG